MSLITAAMGKRKEDTVRMTLTVNLRGIPIPMYYGQKRIGTFATGTGALYHYTQQIT